MFIKRDIISIIENTNNEKSRDKMIILNNFEENKKQISEFSSKITYFT
jgi:hypothetical protein